MSKALKFCFLIFALNLFMKFMQLFALRTLLFIVFAIAISTASGLNSTAQTGGNNTWEFLNLTNSARVASLGGKNISLRDSDLNLVYHNPALLDSSMHNHLVFNYVTYFSNIHFGYASYGFHNSRIGSLAAGIHYINYGTFTGADNTGLITGTFTAAENSVNLYWATPINKYFSAGAAFKIINSSFEQYRSSGVAIDAGINYYNSQNLFSASFVIKNLGTQINSWYSGGTKESLPFEMQLGASKKLAHAPFRLSVVYQHLNDFNLNSNKTSSGQNEPSSNSFTQKIENAANELARHLIIGVEFIPVESFTIQAGYNNLRRHELRIEEKVSTVGFSWGFGVNINRFRIHFGQARFHLAGSSNHFSISTNLASFYTR